MLHVLLGAWLLSLAVGLHAAAALPSEIPSRAGTAFDGDVPRVAGHLVAHPDDTGLGSVRVGVLLEIDPGWHIYAADPGDVGIATEIRWSVPAGEVLPRPWPEPETFPALEGELVSYGYEGRVLFAAEARFEPGQEGGRLVRADVELVACSVECIPGSLRLERDVDLPPEPAVAGGLRDRFAGGPPGQSAGNPPDAPPPDPAASGVGLLRAVILALAGGLLLNLMPCVLPVLALKALSLAELGRHGPREAWPHAAAYAGGVLGSLLLLALVVIALRAAGTAVGWGFQFREPMFIVAVSALLVVFAANLFGAFEFGTPGGRFATLGGQASGARRSFFDGLLTVVLATPCSAPFLGTAVGFAFASPAPVIVAIFLTIGAGLAAPLVLAALLPASARWLPRPGPWMLELRAALGFGLLGAVVWLLWILGRTLGADAVASVAAGLVGVGFASWAYGRLQQRGRRLHPAWLALAGAALVITGAGVVRPEPDASLAHSEPFERALVDQRLGEGRTVFVYFTADWCITCKVNERLVLHNERVQQALARLDVAVLRADWTRRDDTLRAELARFGRSGVPAYVLFSPDEPESPQLLPELLTVQMLLDALEAAAKPAPVTAVTWPSPSPTMGGKGTERLEGDRS